MTPELDEELVRRYPAIFAQRHLGVQQSCMAWGFECGDGWFDIIDALCRAVVEHASATGQAVPQAAQVKEKFGSLRVYWDHPIDDFALGAEEDLDAASGAPSSADDYEFVTGATWMAEALSERTCELTGRPGQLTKRGGYYQTLCPEKARELGAVPASQGKVRVIGKAPPRSRHESAVSAAALVERYHGIMKGPIAVPQSALLVVDALLSQLAEVGKHEPVTVTGISVSGGRLHVAIQGGCSRAAGVVACAQAFLRP